MRIKWIVAGISITGFILFIWFAIINRSNEDLHNSEAQYQLNAEDLLVQFESNELQANTTYINKVVEVTGNIGEISTDNEKGIVIILKKNSDIYGINCSFSDKKAKLDDLRIGDSVCIRGIVRGYLDDVIVNNCILIKN
jgi:hypothetical protein